MGCYRGRYGVGMNAYHAYDCPREPVCDGCGYIAADGLWYPGECPAEDKPFQSERSEG